MGFFELSKIGWFVAAPGNFAVVLLVFALLLRLFRRSRAANGLVFLVTVGLAAIIALPIDQWVARPLESLFPHPDLPDCVAGILVLGGGELSDVSADRDEPAVHVAGRYAAATALQRRYPNARLVFSGGSGDLLHPNASEDQTARRFFTELGVDPGRITFENRSRNTWENLVLSKEILKPGPDENWVLITGAMHIPRSIGIARKVDWPMIPYPTDYETPARGEALHGRLSENLDVLDAATREWAGLLAYKLTGRLDELFPAPETPAAHPCPPG